LHFFYKGKKLVKRELRKISDMAEQDQWQWQKSGTAWRGVGVYHVTLTVPSREPLFGTLVILEGNPSNARIERTALGNAVVDELYVMCRHYPAIRILQFCLMPDHLHAVIRVTRVMDTSIRSVIRGYWQGVKKLGRAYTLAVAAELNSETTNEEGKKAETANEGGESAGRTDEGSYPFPIFIERPFIRPLSRRGQLHTMIRYVQMNPQRLATKRLRPGYFRVQKDIVIGDRKYDGVGNVALLMGEGYDVVHVKSIMVKAAENGTDKPLRDYMNSRVLMARKGVVMVSPFISPQEKRVMQVLLQEKHPFIILTDNGFRDYYKPADILFDACAVGRLLILSPWPYDGGKRHISRSECVALNAMAEEICKYLNGTGIDQ
jgi:REP element-mobilizing transposase RayT